MSKVRACPDRRPGTAQAVRVSPSQSCCPAPWALCRSNICRSHKGGTISWDGPDSAHPRAGILRAGTLSPFLAELDPSPAPTPPNNSASISESQPTLVDKLFKSLKIVVDVAFKLLIDYLELVDRLFKLLNIDVLVDCKLHIFK